MTNIQNIPHRKTWHGSIFHGSCLFYRKNKNGVIGITETLVEGRLSAGNEDFSFEEEGKSKHFDVKPRDSKLPFKFVGLLLNKCGDLLKADQDKLLNR